MLPPLAIGDYPVIDVLPIVESASALEYQSMLGQLDIGIRFGELVLRWPGQISNGSPAAEEPDSTLPINVQMTADNQGAGGNWYQTFEFTILPAGTLADVSNIIYGDEAHVNDIFGIIKKSNQDISSPSQVQVGQKIELTVDASRTSVLKQVIPGETKDSLVRTYYNGVTETIPGHTTTAVVRIVDLPASAPTDTFTIKRGEQEITIPKGNKFIEYSYGEGDSFEETIESSYGILSARAVQDFEQQTRWSFDQWPPAKDETAEATISTTRSYADDVFQVLNLTLPDPLADSKFQALLAQRAQAGIYPIKQRSDGVVYRVNVVDSSITARQVSKLLFNNDQRYLDIVDAAGVRLDTTDPAKIPADFDVLLIGRSFDVVVDYADENYVLSEEKGSGDVVKTTKLFNGTEVDEYQNAEQAKQGMQRIVYYPNNYRRLVYQPDDALVSLFDFTYYAFNLGRVNNEADRRAFIGSMLWSWQRDIPRSAGDIAEDLSLTDSSDSKILNVLVWHREDVGLGELLLYKVWTINPCLTLMTLVLGTSALFMLLVIVIRRIAANRSLD